jgi:RNA polymerase sigma-70 factor, ECF subfamily
MNSVRECPVDLADPPILAKSSLQASSGAAAFSDEDAMTSGAAVESCNVDRLIDQYAERIYQYSMRMALNAADAEDIVQQTFLIAHQRINQLREADKAFGWLCAIARSCFLKMARRNRPVAASTMELNVDEVPETSAQSDWIEGDQLQFALARLNDDHRLILVMFYFEQLTYQEISQRLDLKIGTVMSRLARAKSRLRALLDPAGYDNGNVLEDGTALEDSNVLKDSNAHEDINTTKDSTD